MIRTVLGDIEPADLGVCYAHEHLIIDPSVATMSYPAFQLESVENGVKKELASMESKRAAEANAFDDDDLKEFDLENMELDGTECSV